MAKPKFKQRCALCKENMVIMYSARQFPICVTCHMKKINVEIKDPKMKKLFDIPKKFYEENHFLRNIKEAFIRFENLSEKQVEAFKKTVKELRSEASGSPEGKPQSEMKEGKE
jgi:hypothetical protein|tara:strand:- start:42 stop:380 length:339 start_codon:yes stop_codon:yes gene_type:complete